MEVNLKPKTKYIKDQDRMIRVIDNTYFESSSDISSIASYITNQRYNDPDIFTEPCEYCEGYGIIDETIVQDDNGQYLIGSICKHCNGLGRFSFIEAIKLGKKIKAK